MKVHERLKKIELRLGHGKPRIACFQINYYENPDERAQAKKNLISSYVEKTGQEPDLCVFVLPIPGKSNRVLQDCILS